MIKVKLLKRCVARDKDGKSAFRAAGAIAYLDENTFNLHSKMGIAEKVSNAKPKKTAADPDPVVDEVSDADQPDL